MHIRDLIPTWSRDRFRLATDEGEEGPLVALQRDVNRAFDDFWRRVERPFAHGFGFGAAGPRIDVSETEEALTVSAELPGMDEGDVAVDLADTVLTLRGEKRREAERGEGSARIVERSYGAFHRAIPLPPGIDAEKAEARFGKGVLTVTLPKTAEARARTRRIEVKRALGARPRCGSGPRRGVGCKEEDAMTLVPSRWRFVKRRSPAVDPTPRPTIPQNMDGTSLRGS
ncbi:MAG: Hsp20/alpha crystallin family protein [Rhodobacteraceae bacterium]|nr:MAG: Hsp20/alpha crystallin family protein [Paracoccaceae bacterium]